uniref:Uncharacterized protein n=1 Tax=Avena sativa TaxID=4498 RepID=A0ACD5VEH4_AVESA
MEVKGKTKGGKRSRANSGSGTAAAAATVERKEVERERRQHMKQLCAKLASHIPKENYSSTDTMTQLGSLDEAAKYIKNLKERVDELRRRRNSAQVMATLREIGGVSTPPVTTTTTMNDSEGSLEFEEKPVKLHEVITILEEEGAEIVNANHSVAGLKIFYTIHSRVFSSRIGVEVSRVSERLRALV